MALALGFRAGGKFYVDDTEVTVKSFDGYSSAVVEVKGKTFHINDQAAVDILPQVRVSCGLPSNELLEKYQRILMMMDNEKAARQRALDDGKLTKEELDALPPIELPHEYLPRLVIEAPRRMVILREDLYKRKQRRTQCQTQ